jgi:hypothetical protein
MKRLTIHLNNAPFLTYEVKKNVSGTPLKRKRIQNTLSYTFKDEKAAMTALESLKTSFGNSTSVSKWYTSNIK